MSNCGCNKTPCGCGARATTAMTTATASSASIATRGCGCGGGGCATCGPGGFVRPRFFAGQLLTEEDLALLGDYVVAKHRLHNRALWGPGVVCGLEVHCDPCGDPGRVVVQPGYALSCCGDDLVVSCPETVDVLALIRELKSASLGSECADPCAPAPGTTTLATSSAPIHRYYLYLRYTEQLTDPVSPYATDEPCAGRACEPTRVREGHTYELRCQNDTPQFAGIGDRIDACIGSDLLGNAQRADAQVLSRLSTQVASAQIVLGTTPAPVFTIDDERLLESATTALQAALAALPPGPGGGGQSLLTEDAELLRTALEALRLAGGLFARLVLTPVPQRPTLDPEIVPAAEAALANAIAVLPSRLTKAPLPALERVEGSSTIAMTQPLAVLGDPPASPTYAQRLWSLGVPLDDALLAEARATQGRLLEFVTPRVNPSASRPSDCLLRAAADAILPIADAPVGPTSAASLATHGAATVAVFDRTVAECTCAALNPPCQGCSDPAVLLAEIRVQGCVVVDICAIVRRFVITWPSMRYWTGLNSFDLDGVYGENVPPLGFNLDSIGNVLEEFCCTESTGGSASALLSLAAAAPAHSLGGTVARALAGAVGNAARARVDARLAERVAAAERELAELRSEVKRLSARRPG